MPKKSRATKLTDSDKAWNRRAKPGSYRIGSIPINKTILIVCEGQTEKLYFESFPVLGLKIKAVDLKGQAKLKLIESTQKIIRSTDDEFNDVWCVFDMDNKHGANEYADFDNAINKALMLGYKVGYSNDAFELWFYLHFKHSTAPHIRTFYYKELSHRLGINYVRDGKKYDFCQRLYSILKNDVHSSQAKAIERATELYEEQKALPYHEQNPVTKVYELVKDLNKNLRQ